MKVKELIEVLQKQDPEQRVFCSRDPEGNGFNELTSYTENGPMLDRELYNDDDLDEDDLSSVSSSYGRRRVIMGDRCYVRCYVHCAVRPEDTERFIELFGGEPQLGHNGYCGLFNDVEDEQADGGFEERLCDCAKSGMVFYGYSTPGDAYPAIRFASNGDGDLHRVECVWDCEAVPVVRINDDGDQSPDEYHYACVHMAVYNNVRAMAFPEEKEDEEDMDFGEMLEANLRCSSNEKVIEQMSLHDPENISLLLDYIRVPRSKE